MTARNAITGDEIKSKGTTEAYRNRLDWAFCKHPEHKPEQPFDSVKYETWGTHTCPKCGLESKTNP